MPIHVVVHRYVTADIARAITIRPNMRVLSSNTRHIEKGNVIRAVWDPSIMQWNLIQHPAELEAFIRPGVEALLAVEMPEKQALAYIWRPDLLQKLPTGSVEIALYKAFARLFETEVDVLARQIQHANESEEKKNLSKDEKLKIKGEKGAEARTKDISLSNGEKICNLPIKPPRIFRKKSILKNTTEARDVTTNCSKGSTIPSSPSEIKGKEPLHDRYQNLAADTRKEHTQGVNRKEARQRAVALYFTDELALRAGNEKDTDEAADTVGCCSLRCEHVTLNEELDGKKYVVEFDFIGEDSMRHHIKVPVEKQEFKNLRVFIDGGDLLEHFDMNSHLRSLMPSLTAKVFRTYNASITVPKTTENFMENKKKKKLKGARSQLDASEGGEGENSEDDG